MDAHRHSHRHTWDTHGGTRRHTNTHRCNSSSPDTDNSTSALHSTTRATPNPTTVPVTTASTDTDRQDTDWATIVITAVVTMVAVLMMVAVGVMVTLAAIWFARQRRKNHVYESPEAVSTGNTLVPSNYCEPVSLGISPTHFHHQPHPLHTQVNTIETTLLDSADHIVMQACPAYVALEDTRNSGDYAYIDGDYVYI